MSTCELLSINLLTCRQCVMTYISLSATVNRILKPGTEVIKLFFMLNSADF